MSPPLSPGGVVTVLSVNHGGVKAFVTIKKGDGGGLSQRLTPYTNIKAETKPFRIAPPRVLASPS